jgi:hypothetical protein
MDASNPTLSLNGDTKKTIVVIDKYMENFNGLQEKSHKALIGYAKTDIIRRNLVFGKYNKRSLKPEENRSILDSFNQNGLDRFNINHAIPLVVKKNVVIDDSVVPLSALTFEQLKVDGSHLPILRFVGDPPADDNGFVDESKGLNVVAVGGRHRRAALTDWVKFKKTLAQSERKTLKELEARGKAIGDVEDPQLVDEIQAARTRVKHAQGLVDTNGAWIVTVYDAGA